MLKKKKIENVTSVHILLVLKMNTQIQILCKQNFVCSSSPKI